MVSVGSCMHMLADLFCCMFSSHRELGSRSVLTSLCTSNLTHAAIQVEFLQNKSTVDEGNSLQSLTVQFLLTPADATFQFNIIIALSVSSGSATGTVHW